MDTSAVAAWTSPPAFDLQAEQRLAGAPARRVLARRRWVRRLGEAPTVMATYLSKLSVPPFGAMGLSLATPLMVVAALGGFFAGLMELQLQRGLAFALMLATLLVLQVFAVDSFSVGSLALLVFVHLPYVFQQRRTRGAGTADVLEHYQRVALLIGVLGIAQYMLQFTIGPKFAFPIENLLPTDLTLGKYNSEAILSYGSDVRRANGIFMIEPSLFSQLMALGLIIEMVTRQRLSRLAVMAAGLLVSYSGTGVMLLGACLLFEGVAKRRWALLGGASAVVAVVVAVGVVAELPMVTRIIARSGEFGAHGTSGSMRFVAGFDLFEQFLWPDPVRAFFGFGAGSLATYGARAQTPVAEMMLFKAVFEYGLVGAFAYFGFLGWCLFRNPAPMVVRVGVLLMILMGGMYTPFGHVLACGLLLWPRPVQSVRGSGHA